MNLVKRDYKPLSLWDDIFDWQPFNQLNTRQVVAPVEVETDDDSVYVKAELPGMEKKDIEVDYQDGLLTISGEKKTEKKGREDGYRYSEIAIGRFKRIINLGTEVSFEQGQAEYKDGTLCIKIPKAAPKKSKKLVID